MEGIAMAVAVKPSPEAQKTSRSLNELAVGSWIGILYVLGTLYVVFYALPWLWGEFVELPVSSFVNVALLLGAMLATAAGLGYVGRRLLAHPPHGLRAGIAVGIALLFFAVLITQAVGMTLENMEVPAMIGAGITGAVGVLCLFFLLRAYFRPGFEKWLGRFEDQGWFSLTAYKASQGLRVRRGTILGLLAVAACGIYTMLIRNKLEGDWELLIPYVDEDDWVLVLLPWKKYTLTLLLAAAALWIAWRVVSFPTFADFLIATEAEMNKVSWTTRRRLIQDTIVVLTTVFLLTIFLLIVDVLWFKILSNPLIHVLRIDTTTQQTTTGGERPEW
jgi:preprotein translocase SecE subunit